MGTSSDQQKGNNIFQSRKRYNILKNSETKVIQFLCSIMPSWITSDILTIIGFAGSVTVALGMFMAKSDKLWLLLSILGFAIQWFGDSLDGRLAYYRNTPRKWYGWAIDISVDWISIIIIGFGVYDYFYQQEFVALIFVCMYGWSMINALLRYKITDQYVIDSNAMGPTELRIIICIFILGEYLESGTLWYFALLGSILLVIFNIKDLLDIIKAGHTRDEEEKAAKALQK